VDRSIYILIGAVVVLIVW